MDPITPVASKSPDRETHTPGAEGPRAPELQSQRGTVAAAGTSHATTSPKAADPRGEQGAKNAVLDDGPGVPAGAARAAN